MDSKTPPLDPASTPATIAGADGTRTIGEIAANGRGNPLLVLGKRTIKDAGRRMAQIRGLKPGSTSIRTVEMIEEILTRLNDGETMTSILCDSHMPAPQTLWNWCDADQELSASIAKAQAQGQRALADLRMNIAMGGEFSTGDIRRDAELIKAINANIAQRNRAEFGEQKAISISTNMPVMLAPIPGLPDLDAEFRIEDAEIVSKDDEEGDDA
jgi:hypothetical protein